MDALVSKVIVKRWLNSIGVYGYESKVDALPSIEAESKPMHWIDTAECRFKYFMDSRFRCSMCGKGYDFKYRFCPNCGKKADNPSGFFESKDE